MRMTDCPIAWRERSTVSKLEESSRAIRVLFWMALPVLIGYYHFERADLS